MEAVLEILKVSWRGGLHTFEEERWDGFGSGLGNWADGYTLLGFVYNSILGVWVNVNIREVLGRDLCVTSLFRALGLDDICEIGMGLLRWPVGDTGPGWDWLKWHRTRKQGEVEEIWTF